MTAEQENAELRAQLAEANAELLASTDVDIQSAKAKIALLRENAALCRYAEALGRGLSDSEARAEGWPALSAAPHAEPDGGS